MKIQPKYTTTLSVLLLFSLVGCSQSLKPDTDQSKQTDHTRESLDIQKTDSDKADRLGSRTPYFIDTRPEYADYFRGAQRTGEIKVKRATEDFVEYKGRSIRLDPDVNDPNIQFSIEGIDDGWGPDAWVGMIVKIREKGTEDWTTLKPKGSFRPAPDKRVEEIPEFVLFKHLRIKFGEEPHIKYRSAPHPRRGLETDISKMKTRYKNVEPNPLDQFKGKDIEIKVLPIPFNIAFKDFQGLTMNYRFTQPVGEQL